ncbi:hypothetical protein BV22DRAFT_1106683 [Leucogyrophana mollusca]|uniref:Uncharacterized protein n=1 Tax=Leucogyrophana mollusca TaxID=85980 RepID=A0ACB8B9J9_9AGAM|nr:hypothetical protein BV22DRAFT_1106683 [Leucogyrophana mollusca]
MPCSPISPSVAITIDALEFYWVAHHRNPHFSIQGFVKTISDLHGVQFHRHLSRQFSIAYDLYLQIRASVDALVLEALQRDSSDWRLKNACPACTYTLEGEGPLTFKFLYAMDGNDSLKRVLRKFMDCEDDETAQSSELPTTQKVRGDRYLDRDFVEKFANSVNEDDEVAVEIETHLSQNNTDENPCAGRWKNMDDQGTKKSWGIFDETGLFLAVCRHGFSLVMADMVRSGERAKYPLAVVSKLLDTFGEDLGGGYDIGCQFKTTLDNSSIGARARSLRHTCLVPAFHGHAHRRLCQLLHLAVYIRGLGLEDLETCERTFSKSNALASSLRHASAFHRRQAIASYFEYNDDNEIYQNLSTFLHNNYKQALDILSDGKLTLAKLMKELDLLDESVFDRWLDEERAYLQGLQREPEVETLQMEYWQKLINMAKSRKDLDATNVGWNVSTPDNMSLGRDDIRSTAKSETARRHAQENYDRDLQVVQGLEARLEITQRWAPGDAEWQSTAKLVANRKYQRALDTLESLIVARIFELTKMNQSGTGYKMRKHIGKALQTRSAAIRTALERYNVVAQAMTPPRPKLEWDKVVEYAFLADFDLLRDTREDISQRPWATPKARRAMDLYFKMQCAQEEIDHLNIEIRRLTTYIQDEDRYLRVCEDQLKDSHPALAHQVALRRGVHACFNGHHLQHLNDISKLRGFSGTLAPGKSTRTGPGDTRMDVDIPTTPLERPGASSVDSDNLEDLEEEEGDDVDVEEISQASRTFSLSLRMPEGLERYCSSSMYECLHMRYVYTQYTIMNKLQKIR